MKNDKQNNVMMEFNEELIFFIFFFYDEPNPPKQDNLEKILGLFLSICKSLPENIGRCN